MGALIGVANLFCFVLGVPSLKREVFWTTILFTSMGNWGNLPLAVLSAMDSSLFSEHAKEVGTALIVSFIGICNIYFFTVGHIGTEKDSLSSKEREATLSVDPDSSLPLTQTLPESDADADPAPRSKFCQSPVVTTLLRKYHQISDPVSRAIHKTPSRRMAWDALTHPATLSVICGWTFALITPVRRLFVPQDEDGSAPLGFFLETLSFVGSFAVPLGLINLGSALGRIRASKETLLPLPFIASVVFSKLLLIPGLGILICQALRANTPLFDGPDSDVLLFVFMFQGCVPTANTLVFLTQYHSPSGKADKVASLVLIQYCFAVLTLPAWIALIIHLL
ncbi:MAG: hypothetical protein SGCHY_005059 [Lobulomycetales sp.]